MSYDRPEGITEGDGLLLFAMDNGEVNVAVGTEFHRYAELFVRVGYMKRRETPSNDLTVLSYALTDRGRNAVANGAS